MKNKPIFKRVKGIKKTLKEINKNEGISKINKQNNNKLRGGLGASVIIKAESIMFIDKIKALKP